MDALNSQFTKCSSTSLLISYILMNYAGWFEWNLTHSTRTSPNLYHVDIPSSVWFGDVSDITEPVSPTAIRIIWKSVNSGSVIFKTLSSDESNDDLFHVILRSTGDEYVVALLTNAEPIFPRGCNSSTTTDPGCIPFFYRLTIGRSDRFPITATFPSVPLARPTAMMQKGMMKYSVPGDSEYNQIVFPQLRPDSRYSFIVQRVLHQPNLSILKTISDFRKSKTIEIEYNQRTDNDSNYVDRTLTPISEPPDRAKWIATGSDMTFKEPGVLNIQDIEPTSCLLIFTAETYCPPHTCGTVVQLLFRYTTIPHVLDPDESADAIMSKYPANRDIHQMILGGSNYQEQWKNKSDQIFILITQPITGLEPNSVYFYNFLILYNTNFIYLQMNSRFKTPKGVPDPPINLQITVDQDGSYRVEWAPPINSGGDPVQSYALQYQVAPKGVHKAQNHSWEQIIIDDNKGHHNNNYTIKPEKCTDCNLFVKVAANNSVGTGNFSKIIATNISGNRKMNVAVTTILVIVGMAFLLMGGTSVYCYRKKSKSAKEEMKVQLPPIILPKDLDSIPKITCDQTKVLEKLGEGNFGTVYAGLAFGLINDSMSGGKAQKVALKMLKEGASMKQRSEIINEALTMRNFHHPNVLGLLGLCSEDPRFWLVLEYMDSGNLCQYLKDLRPQGAIPSQVSLCDLGRMVKQVIAGAVYVESLGYTHRDLAARNILVNGRDPEQCHLKISDFGLTRGLYKAQYYRMTERSIFPVRWTAPEVYKSGVFDLKSDTWAFEMLVWEIASLGETPYSQFTDPEVIQFVLDGGTEVSPANCGQPLGQIMLQCWEHDSFRRKSLSEISSVIENTFVDLNDPQIEESEKCRLRSPYFPEIIALHRKIIKTDIKHENTTKAKPINGHPMSNTPTSETVPRHVTLNRQSVRFQKEIPYTEDPIQPGTNSTRQVTLNRQTSPVQKDIPYTEPIQQDSISNPIPTASIQCTPMKTTNSHGICQTTSFNSGSVSTDPSSTQSGMESNGSLASSNLTYPMGYTDPQQLVFPIPAAYQGAHVDPNQDNVHIRAPVYRTRDYDESCLPLLPNNLRNHPEDSIRCPESNAFSDLNRPFDSRDTSSLDNPNYSS